MGAEGEPAAAVDETQLREATTERPMVTPTITAAQFLSWKRRKDEIAAERKAEAARKREEDITAGTVQMNGRELFLREPWIFDNSRY